ncbi:MAG: hypothetical protein HY360_10010 [Verrucomicrobia bacterium]|nr:hypothetical protein [Verrucomicrobiota bacterium]
MSKIVLMLMALCSALGSASDGDKRAGLTVAPRWNKVWLSPRLKGNWVVIRYEHKFAKGQAPAGTVLVELPPEVTCLSAVIMPFEQQPCDGGGARVLLKDVPLDGSKNGMYLCLATTLKTGANAKGRIWAEWKNGKSVVTEFPIQVIETPVARQPREIMTGTAVWPYMIASWPDFYQQYASLGFNQMNLWHDSIYCGGYRDKGRKPYEDLIHAAQSATEQRIMLSLNASVSWNRSIIEKDHDAQALFLRGQRGGPCPSYRGPGFVEGIHYNAAIADSGISWIQSDEEEFGSGGFSQACVCPRCEDRWKKWLKENRPALKHLSPEEIIADQAEFPEHWRAWLWFRASLTTERYKLYKEELEKAVAKYGAHSSPKPLLGWWAGAVDDATLEGCMQDGRALANTIDQVILQHYYRYGLSPRRFRETFRRQCWALAGKNCYAALDSDWEDANVPGNMAASALETLFAGGSGYSVWYGPYMDTRQWTELAAVNDLIAQHEETFLKGKDTDLFRCFATEGKEVYFPSWSQDICTATRETDAEGLLLITDYRKERKPVWIERSMKYAGPLALIDALTGQPAAQLAAGQWDFFIYLKDSPWKLLVWKKGAKL